MEIGPPGHRAGKGRVKNGCGWEEQPGAESPAHWTSSQSKFQSSYEPKVSNCQRPFLSLKIIKVSNRVHQCVNTSIPGLNSNVRALRKIPLSSLFCSLCFQNSSYLKKELNNYTHNHNLVNIIQLVKYIPNYSH